MYDGTYTLVTKTRMCPKWQVDVKVTAKYLYQDNTSRAKFSSAECEITKNLKLTRNKRNRELSLFAYCDIKRDCPCLDCFPKEINSV